MWRKMMRIWLMGAAVTLGGLDGLPDCSPGDAAVRGDWAADWTASDRAPDRLAGQDDGGEAAAGPPQPIST